MSAGETRLAAYLAASGTKLTWLADQCGVNISTVTRWCKGQTSMRESDRERVMAAFRGRAALPLDGLLDDQRLRRGAPKVEAEVGQSASPLKPSAPLTGAYDPARHRAPIRQVARCQRCHRDREGLTTFDSMVYGGKPVGRPIHFCDECDAALKESERPLADVLDDYVSGRI